MNSTRAALLLSIMLAFGALAGIIYFSVEAEESSVPPTSGTTLVEATTSTAGSQGGKGAVPGEVILLAAEDALDDTFDCSDPSVPALPGQGDIAGFSIVAGPEGGRWWRVDLAGDADLLWVDGPDFMFALDFTDAGATTDVLVMWMPGERFFEAFDPTSGETVRLLPDSGPGYLSGPITAEFLEEATGFEVSLRVETDLDFPSICDLFSGRLPTDG